MPYQIQLNREKLQAMSDKPYAFMPLKPVYGPEGLIGVIPGLAHAGEVVGWYGDPDDPPAFCDPMDDEARTAYAAKAVRSVVATGNKAQRRLARLEAEAAKLREELGEAKPAKAVASPAAADRMAKARAARKPRSLSAEKVLAPELHTLPEPHAPAIMPAL